LQGAWLESRNTEWAVVFLHGKGGYRIGPNRIFCEAATELDRRGISSLRFDYRGRGDSDGEGFSLERELNEQDIDRCVEDARCAMDYVVSHHRRVRILLCGMCMGGYVALRALKKAPGELAGLCLLSPYFMGVENLGTTRWRLVLHALGQFGRKGLRLQNWVSLVSGQASLGRVVRAMFHPLGGKHRSSTVVHHRQSSVQNRVPCLRVFGRRDPLHSEVIRQIDQLHGVRLDLHTVIIEQADHSFSSPEAHHAVIAQLCDYATRLPVNAEDSPSR
jgi:pimeloyl-ACP methyl ester carboxylesterase